MKKLSFILMTLLGIYLPVRGISDPISSPALDDDEPWEVFSNAPYDEIAYPDPAVQYRRVRLEWPQNWPVSPVFTGFEIKGTFPLPGREARYINFHTYDERMSAAPMGKGSLNGRSIKPDAGSHNPFAGAPASAENRNYTLYVLPPEVASDPQKTFVGPGGVTHRVGEVNVLSFPTSESRQEIWYRVYLPKRDGQDDPEIEEPKLSTFDLTNGKAIERPQAGPKTFPLRLVRALRNKPPANDQQMHFYRPLTEALYPNDPDNYYLVSQHKPGTLSAFRFVPPPLQGKPGVAFYSIAVGGGVTQTASGVADPKMEATGHQRYFVVGPHALRDKIVRAGKQMGIQINFLDEGEWPAEDKLLYHFPQATMGGHYPTLIIYRNVLTDPRFPGSMENVPAMKPGLENPAFANSANMGEYAPVGQVCGIDPEMKELKKCLQAIQGGTIPQVAGSVRVIPRSVPTGSPTH